MKRAWSEQLSICCETSALVISGHAQLHEKASALTMKADILRGG